MGGGQIGFGRKKAKQLTKPELGHFQAAGVPLKRKLAEFRVSRDALLPVGTEINVRHFVAGQYIDITGTTTGKGFQVVTHPVPSQNPAHRALWGPACPLVSVSVSASASVSVSE